MRHTEQIKSSVTSSPDETDVHSFLRVITTLVSIGNTPELYLVKQQVSDDGGKSTIIML